MSNITHISPDSFPLTYRKLGNLLASLGKNDSKYDETECYRLVFSQLNHFWSWETGSFLLASPFVTHEIEDLGSLSFSAEANKNIFGDDLRLAMDPQIVNYISRQDFRSSLGRAYRDADFSVDKLLPLFQVPHQKLNNPSKETISSVMFNVLNTVSNFLDLNCEPDRKLPIVGSPLFSSVKPTYGSIAPDYCIRDKQHNVVCVVNIKPPCLFADNPKPLSRYPVYINDFCKGNMAEIMIELQMCMIAACRRFGIVCDGHHLVLMEFVDDCFYYQENYLHCSPSGRARISLQRQESLRIPFKLLVVTLDGKGISFLESLIYFFYRAKQAEPLTPDSPIYKYLQLALKPRNTTILIQGVPNSVALASSREVPIFGIEATLKDGILHKTLFGIEATQVGHCEHSTSFKVQAKHLRDVIENDIDDEEYVVMKIYKELMVDYYLNEWKAIRTLDHVQDFNNIYLLHQKVKTQCFFLGHNKPITGYAVISKFIESHPIPRTPGTYELATHQLEILHEAGVAILDFSDGKVIFSAGKFYFHVSGHSQLRSECDPDKWGSRLLNIDSSNLVGAIFKLVWD